MGTETVVTRRAPARRMAGMIGWYVALTALSLLILFPIWMTLVQAASTPIAYLRAVADGPQFTPVESDWGVFGQAARNATLQRALLLSFGVTAVIVIAQVLTSVLAAYAFAFLDFFGKKVAFLFVIGTLLLPIEVTLVANFETIRNLGWINSLEGLTVPFLATALGIFLLRQAFLGIPKDLQDAATLDGYGHLRFLFVVAVPIARPIIGSFVLISFLSAFNQYVWPRYAATNEDWKTVQVTLRDFGRANVDQLNLGFAAALLAAVPLVILLIAFQRQLIRGLTAGAVKG